MNTRHIAGISAAVIKDGYWLYQNNWGKADIAANKDVKRQTVFMMASVSKTIIATALMQLWEKGAFQLDDDIRSFLPFPVQYPAYPSDLITFRMLATHTSGMKDNYNVLNQLYVLGDSPISLDTFLRNYFVPNGTYYDAANNFYTYHTGSTFDYSNIGATMAAYLVQRITGDDFGHYCDTAIFQKICMDNTSYKLAGIKDTTLIARPYDWYGNNQEDVGLYGYPDYPDGQLRTHITALARFMKMYLQHGMYEGTRVLNSATIDTMMRQQTAAEPSQGIFFYSGKLGNDLVWGHQGSDVGVCTAMFMNYVNKTGVIVFANSSAQTANAGVVTLLDTLYRYGRTLTPNATDVFPQCGATTAVATVRKDGMFNAVIYPNPASQLTWLQIDAPKNQKLEIVLTDLSGRLVKYIYSGDVPGDGKIAMDVRDMQAGLYLVSVSTSETHKNLQLAVMQ